jgi:O-acetylhomoserine/O-acetylserine sulfhydrylase-like pyridoxal-dependent enzyme
MRKGTLAVPLTGGVVKLLLTANVQDARITHSTGETTTNVDLVILCRMAQPLNATHTMFTVTNVVLLTGGVARLQLTVVVDPASTTDLNKKQTVKLKRGISMVETIRRAIGTYNEQDIF